MSSSRIITNKDERTLRDAKWPPEFDKKVDKEEIQMPVIAGFVDMSSFGSHILINSKLGVQRDGKNPWL